MISTSWHCYVINLDRSPERFTRISEQLNILSIPFERFAAIDGRNIDPDNTPLFSRKGYERRHGKEPTPCEIGCFLSHLGVMRRFLESDARFCLILEDDAILNPGIVRILNGLEEHFRQWNVALLYGNYTGMPQRLASITEGYELSGFLARQTGAVAYVVDRKAAASYLRNLLPMTLPIDVDFDRAWDFDIRFRGVVPFPVTTGGYASDIGAIGKKFPWHRRIPTYLARGMGELRRYRHYFYHDPIWLQSWTYLCRLPPILRREPHTVCGISRPRGFSPSSDQPLVRH